MAYNISFSRAAQGPARLAAAFATTALLAGCAATQGPPQASDPFEGYNRGMYAINDGLDKAFLKPVATVYRDITPSVARDGVSNFFSNLGDAWSFVNNLLQGRWEASYFSMVRFSVNSVLGLGGLLDIASEAGVDRYRQDFGQTLGRWGVPAGPYLVLPVLGPSSVRDALALPVDWQGNTISHMGNVPVRNSLLGLRLVDARMRLLGAGDMLDSVALDRYSLTRDVYLGLRRGGASDDGRTPDYDDGNDGRLPPEE